MTSAIELNDRFRTSVGMHIDWSHLDVVAGGMVFCKVVSQILSSFSPVWAVTFSDVLGVAYDEA